MDKPVFHVDDQEVQDKAENAAMAACKVLDEMFPGFDNGGITSNFTGHLKSVIVEMLTGNAVPYRQSLSSTSLPKLVLNDADFGDRCAHGDMFLIIRNYGNQEVFVGGAEDLSPENYRLIPRLKALNWDGSSFVDLTDGEALDPFTGFDVAVKGAMDWLRRAGMTQEQARLTIVPVKFADKGYAICSGKDTAVAA